ncbi:uncharacterized protein LOC117294701, partial [Asterias rubens]|uniref:uncharacterized protein LOC117294701 n=1 Tax=Asterias rubens TaxID=7604 RepID=UPI001455BA63
SRSPCSPTAHKGSSIYHLTPSTHDVMSPKTNLPAPLEAMSNVLIHREPGLPVIDGSRGSGALRPAVDHSQTRHVTMPPPPARSNSKRNYSILRSSVSDSFLHTRVELLEDALNTGAEPFRGVVPSSRQESRRRPSTPIVESASKAVLGARRQLRKLSLSEQVQTRTDYDTKTIKGFSDAKRKQANRTIPRMVHPKGNRSPRYEDVNDLVKEIENGSFCVWREKTRSLRRASQTSSKNTDRENPTMTREDGRETMASNKQPEQKTTREETVIRHLNYCSSRKTKQVVNWLKEINKQDSFEVIE